MAGPCPPTTRPPTTTKKERRHRHLAALLEKRSTLRVGELARALEVTPETVRRDLDEMAELGLVERTYGGAVARVGREPCLNERHKLLVPEREAIARAAAPLVAGAATLMIGSGATTLHVARRIAIELTDLTVVTHSVGVATALSLNPTISVLIVPGLYHAGEGATHGPRALRFIDDFRADWAILGASGLAADGAMDALIGAGEVYAAMIGSAARTMIVADGSKFGKVFPARFARWKDVDRLVTDRRPRGALRTALGDATAVTLAAT